MSKLGKIFNENKCLAAFSAVTGVAIGTMPDVDLTRIEALSLFITACAMGLAGTSLDESRRKKNENKTAADKGEKYQYSLPPRGRSIRALSVAMGSYFLAVSGATMITEALADKETDKEPEAKTVTMTQADLAPRQNDLKTYQYKPC